MTDKDAGSDAAKLQSAGIRQGIEEQRRQFDETKALLNPYIDAGNEFLDDRSFGATLEGFGSSLNHIMNNTQLDPLREKRFEAINAQFGKAGLLNSSSRSAAIANDLTDFTFGIEQLLAGRQMDLLNGGKESALGLSGFGHSTANNISNSYGEIGRTMADGSLADAQADAAFKKQILGLALGAAGGGAMGGMGMLGPGVGAGQGAMQGLMFSDGRLKENLIVRGELGPLTLYEWDWIPELKAIGIEPDMTIGFLAEDVEAIFPKFVHKVGRFKAVDYAGLIDKLEEVTH